MWFLYSRFKGRKWKKYSLEKRIKVLVALEQKIAKQLKIEPLKIEIKYEDWNCFGAFTAVGNDWKIVLSSKLIEDPRYRFHAIETIAHETRHAYQYQLVNRELKWYEFTAKKWKRNWEGYFSSSKDMLMYNNQAIERDAQKYSIKILKKHRGRYKNEAYWNETYDAVLHRYEQADLDARKEYGLFYKFKIENNVKKKAKKNNRF